MNEDLSLKKEKQAIWEFVLPLIAMNALELLISRISLSFATRTSLDALASIAAVDNLLYALAGIFGAFSVIFNIESAKALGRHDEQKLHELIQSIFAINGKVGGSFLLAIVLFHTLFLKNVYGFEGELLASASRYLVIQAPSLFLQISIFSFTGIMKIEKRTSLILYLSIFTSILQVGLSYLFINVFDWGVSGAAVASVLLLLAQLLLYAFLTRKLLSQARKARACQQKLLVSKGLPIGMEEILEGTLFIIALDALAARMGLFAFSLYSLLCSLIGIMKIATYVYGNAATVFVGEALGEKNPVKIRQLTNYMLKVANGWYFAVAILLAVFSPVVMQLFTADQKLIEAVFPYQLFIILVAIPTTFYEIIKYVLQTMDASRYVFICTAIVNLGIVGVMFMLTKTNALTIFSLFAAYSANFLVLSGLFFWKYRKITTNKAA